MAGVVRPLPPSFHEAHHELRRHNQQLRTPHDPADAHLAAASAAAASSGNSRSSTNDADESDQPDPLLFSSSSPRSATRGNKRRARKSRANAAGSGGSSGRQRSDADADEEPPVQVAVVEPLDVKHGNTVDDDEYCSLLSSSNGGGCDAVAPAASFAFSADAGAAAVVHRYDANGVERARANYMNAGGACGRAPYTMTDLCNPNMVLGDMSPDQLLLQVELLEAAILLRSGAGDNNNNNNASTAAAANESSAVPRDMRLIQEQLYRKWGLPCDRPPNHSEINARFHSMALALWSLYEKYLAVCLVGSETLETMENARRFSHLHEQLTSQYEELLSQSRCYLLSNPGAVHDSHHVMTVYQLGNLEYENMDAYTALTHHVLQQLFKFRFRRRNKQCYKQIMVTDMHGHQAGTHAWEPAMDIASFVRTVCTKELQPMFWPLISNPMTLNKIVTNMQTCVEVEFPELRPDRHVFSFVNGVYFVHEQRFMPYGGKDVIPTEVVACKFHPLFFDVKKVEPFLTKELWHRMETPNMEQLLDLQEFSAEVKKMWYVAFGRLFFNAGIYGEDEKPKPARFVPADPTKGWSIGDDWQKALCIIGPARSGKTTLVNLLMRCYDHSDIGIIDPNMEIVFGPCNLMRKYVCVCSEMRKRMNMTQAFFQECISTSIVNAAVKNGSPIIERFRSPMFFVGNELVDYKCASGSITRRWWMFRFTKTTGNPDPGLADRLYQELPVLIAKCTHAYLRSLNSHPGQDVERWWPEYFNQTKAFLAEQSHPLRAFLMSSHSVTPPGRVPDSYISLAKFWELHTTWLRSLNIRSKQQFDLAYYDAIFAEYKLQLCERELEEPATGDTVSQVWLQGVGDKQYFKAPPAASESESAKPPAPASASHHRPHHDNAHDAHDQIPTDEPDTQ